MHSILLVHVSLICADKWRALQKNVGGTVAKVLAISDLFAGSFREGIRARKAVLCEPNIICMRFHILNGSIYRYTNGIGILSPLSIEYGRLQSIITGKIYTQYTLVIKSTFF